MKEPPWGNDYLTGGATEDTLWHWCRECGRRWLGQCNHPGTSLVPFLDQIAVRAAYRLGGRKAVHDVEHALYLEQVVARVIKHLRCGP